MRGHQIGKKDVEDFIDTLDLDPAMAERLKTLTPSSYTGAAETLVDFDRA